MRNKKLKISLGTILGIGGALVSTAFISCSKKQDEEPISKTEIKKIIKETIKDTIKEVIDSEIDTDIKILIAKLIKLIQNHLKSNYKTSMTIDIFNNK